MAIDLTEPNNELVASVWAEVDAAYPSLNLPDEPTEEEQIAYDEREVLRRSEFDSRYTTQRTSQILTDRATLDTDLIAEIETWDSNEPIIRKSGRVVKLGEREAILRTWAKNAIDSRTPTVPSVLTPRQFRLALLQGGISPDMVTAQLSGNDAALIEWEYASEIKRDHPLIGALAAKMGKSDAEIDQIFILGGTY